MSRASPFRKPKRLAASVSDTVPAEFMGPVDRGRESAGVILRGLASEAIARGRRGEPLLPRLVAGTPTLNMDGRFGDIWPDLAHVAV